MADPIRKAGEGKCLGAGSVEFVSEPAPLGPPPSAATRGLEAAELTAAKAVTPPTANDEEFADPIEHVDGSRKNADAKSADLPS